MAHPTDTHQGDARRLNHPAPPGDKGVLRSHGRVGVDSFPLAADGADGAPKNAAADPAATGTVTVTPAAQKGAPGEQVPRGAYPPETAAGDTAGHKAVPAAHDVAPGTRAKFAELLAVITEHSGDMVAPIDVERLRSA